MIMFPRSIRIVACETLALFGFALAPAAAAETVLDEPEPASIEPKYERGETLPLGLRAERGETAFVTVDGGYDGARKAGRFDAAAELHLVGPIYLRGGATYVSNDDQVKPTVGALVQLFSSEGLSGAVGVFYKPEGLTEPEGEIEGTFAVGLRLERMTLVANVTYGQDGEGTERDGEVRLGGSYRVARRIYAGVDSRLRFSLGSEKAGEPDFDVLAGPLVTVVAFEMAFTAQAGISAVKIGGTDVGPMMLIGVGRIF
jgi:hypothetical protein